VVSVIAIRPKVRGFKPNRRRLTFKSDKNPHHAKPSVPCHKMLRHLKKPFEIWKKYFRG